MPTQVLSVELRYSHTIGRFESVGLGFNNPVAMAVGAEDRLYVLSRGTAGSGQGKRVTLCTVGEDYIGEFGTGLVTVKEEAPAGDGYLVWPTSIALDKEGNVYVADEWLNCISIFTGEGDWIGKWGTPGDGDGEINGPSGIAFDPEDNVYLVDSKNNRVEKFSKSGQFLATWGGAGNGDGQFNLPWGIDIDLNGDVYVADWRNDRVQKFAPDGRFLMKFGSSGTGDGEFNRPTGVAVDREGIIYVTDWGNNRVQVFDADGRFITSLAGDATVSKWGKLKLDANPDMWKEREVAQGLEREKLFFAPIGVEVDDNGRIFIVEASRYRIQVYRKIPPYFLGMYDNGRL